MHGTYFAQNEVFEDESAGEVRLPLSSLGAERRVYLGKSVEGVLRHRSAAELSALFRESYVCIRRFRTSDGRLLPLVLDPPRLLKHRASPSDLAMHVGLARAWVPPTVAGSGGQRDEASPEVVPCATAPVGTAATKVSAHGGDRQHSDESVSPTPSKAVHVEGHNPAEAADAAPPESSLCRATLESGLRLFSLYLAAGGALCMRPAVWRKLMTVLHPDKGGDVRVFQHVSALKRDVDAGAEVTADTLQDYVKRAGCHGQCSTLSRVGSPLGAAIISQCTCSQAGGRSHGRNADELFQKVRAELIEAARPIGGATWDAAQCL